MNRQQLRSDIATLLDRLLSAHYSMVGRQIDVTIIGSQREWDDLHAAQDAYEEDRNFAINTLVKLVTESK